MTVETNDEYIPRDDESEAKRVNVRDASGLGEPIYLDEDAVRQYAIADFGLNVSHDRT